MHISMCLLSTEWQMWVYKCTLDKFNKLRALEYIIVLAHSDGGCWVGREGDGLLEH